MLTFSWKYDVAQADTTKLFTENKNALHDRVRKGLEADAPLFLYFPGTTMRWDAQPAQTTINYMARKGFVAIGVQYPKFNTFDKKWCKMDVKAHDGSSWQSSPGSPLRA